MKEENEDQWNVVPAWHLGSSCRWAQKTQTGNHSGSSKGWGQGKGEEEERLKQQEEDKGKVSSCKVKSSPGHPGHWSLGSHRQCCWCHREWDLCLSPTRQQNLNGEVYSPNTSLLMAHSVQRSPQWGTQSSHTPRTELSPSKEHSKV